MRRVLATAVLAFLLMAIAPACAFGHAVGVDCTLRGAKVEVEAFYDDDSPAQQAKVLVVNARDEFVASGVTDAKGRWTFATPPPGKYEVRVDAGAGHRAKKAINVPAPESAVPVPSNDPPPAPPTTITEGPTRAEFTRFPWVQVLIGVVVLGGVGGAFAISTVLRKNGTKGCGPCER
jgi:nickel transport protein